MMHSRNFPVRHPLISSATRWGWAIVLLVLSSVSALPQTVFGTIFGTVTDTSGAPVASARITITETTKNVNFNTTTNESGNYTRSQLIPGTYRIEVESPGFRKAIVSLEVRVDATSRADIRLTVGEVSEKIEVSAEAPLLETGRADVATTFSSSQIVQLPNLSRNLVSLMFLTPGVQSIGAATPVSENPQGGFRVMVNGQNFGNTGYQLDGTENQDPILGNVVVNPNLDSLSQAKFATEDFDAEFGYVGAGMFVMSTKSGSNQWHGSAFEYLANNSPSFKTSGRNPFSEPNGAPTVKSNQFGGSLGGRILKDKLFFFGDAQLTRRRQDANLLTTVPTLAARGGDLGAYLTQSGTVTNNLVYDPSSGDTATGQNRLAFPNNAIPSNRLSPQAAALLKYFPAPNTIVGGVPYRNNYIASGTTQFDAEQWGGRVDYYRDEKNNFFGRFTQAAFNTTVPGAFGDLAGGPGLDASGFSGQSNVLNHSIAAGYTRTVSANSVNEFRLGFFRYRVDVTPGGFGTQPAAEAGIPGLNLDKTFTSGLPYFNIAGDGGTGLGYSLTVNRCNCPLAERERQFQFTDNFSLVRGNHSLKFGADVRYALNLRVPSDLHRSGELAFASGYTGRVDTNGATSQGLGLGTFLLGQVTSFQRYVSPNTEAAERQKRSYFYAQDSWRVSPKLTVSYGLRWELIFPETVNAAGNGGALDLSTGKIAVYGVGKTGIDGIQKMRWTNLAPRLGVTYQLNPKTVLRAGYGWSYGLGVFGSVFGHVTTQNLPVLAQQALNPANSFSGVFTLSQGPTAPVFAKPDADGFITLPNGVSPRVRPETITLPLVMAHNVTLQRQITARVAATASYVGNQGRHVLNGNGNTLDLNQAAFIPGVPNQNLRKPYFGKYGWTQSVTYYCNCANSSYDAFQAKIELRDWHGYTLIGNYNYQYARGDSANSYTFLYNRPLGYGNQPTVSRQQILVNQVAELPFGRGRKFGGNWNRALDAAAGGWNLSGVTTFYTGLPFTATIGTYPTSVNGVPYTRPDVGPAYPDQGSGSPFDGAKGDRTQWFKGGLGGAFVLPAVNTYGNFGFNNLFGPKFVQQDLSLAKSFLLREGMRFHLRAEAYNLFNHTNLGLPNANITDAAAGQITSIPFGTTLRRMQFAARLEF